MHMDSHFVSMDYCIWSSIANVYTTPSTSLAEIKLYETSRKEMNVI